MYSTAFRLVVITFCMASVLGYYNSTCKFHLPDKEVYDLSSLQITDPKDYTHREGDTLYVVNFCGPAIKTCNGIEKAFASIWNMATFECVSTLAEGNPTPRYIDPKVPSRGIIIDYNWYPHTQLEIECDQAFSRAGLVRAGKIAENPTVYKFWLKSKHVCRNFAEPEASTWSWFTILLVFVFICGLVYFIVGVCMNLRKSPYTSFAESIPHKEFWFSVVFRAKEWTNSALGHTTAPDVSLPSHTPAI